MAKQFALAPVAALALIACSKTDKTANDTATTADKIAVTETTDGYGVTDANAASQGFVTKAAQAGMMEIKAGEIAQTRGKRADVKELGEMLAADHKEAADKLKVAAGTEYAVPASLDASEQAKIDDINDSDADNFDKDYLDLQEEAHEQAVDLFEDYSTNGTDPELKAFAAAILPTLRQHLDHVRELRQGFDPGDDAMGVGSGEADSSETRPEEPANEPN